MNTSLPLVSIITPCFNAEKTILETIDSVCKQEYPHIEHILIDDGSAISLIDIIPPKLAARCILLRQENKGVSHARNYGVSVATGDYLLMLDSDDLIDPTFLSKAIKIHQKYPETSLVGCYVQTFGRIEEKHKITPFNLYEFHYLNTLFPSILLLKKQDFEAVNGYDTALKVCEDWDLYLKIVQQRPKVHIIPEYLFFYRKHHQRGSLTDQMGSSTDLVYQSYQRIQSNQQFFFEETKISIISLAFSILKIDKRIKKGMLNISMLLITSIGVNLLNIIFNTHFLGIFGLALMIFALLHLFSIKKKIFQLKHEAFRKDWFEKNKS